MFTLMYLVVTVGLISGIALLAITVATRRTAPERRALWITGPVVLGAVDGRGRHVLGARGTPRWASRAVNEGATTSSRLDS